RICRLRDLPCELIAATHRCFPGAEPGNLPGKTNGRTISLVIVVVPGRAGIRRILPDKLDFRVRATNAGLHPVGETRTGDSPDTRWTAHGQRHQPIRFVWSAIVVPSQTKIEGERTPDLPVIFKEDASFIAMQISNTVWKTFEVFPRRQLFRILHE